MTEVLELCGLAPYHIDRYPHEFSGGQRQRIVIARAMVLNPEFIVADEPVAALDVSIQAQIINLFSELQEKKGLSYLFISHDLSVVEHLCTKIGIMYLGTIVETAPRDELLRIHFIRIRKHCYPLFQYQINSEARENHTRGDIPSPANPPSGCRFHTLPFATDICKQTVPEFRNVGEEHFVACHHV